MITRKMIDAVKGFEGLKLTAYKCPAGVWTIGYGHTKGVTPEMKISAGIAEKWLVEDLNVAATEVLRLTKGVILTSGQLDALTDFVFNLGATRFKQSTLLKKVRSGAPIADVQSEFAKWVYSGKVKPSGLVKRRAWEAKRYGDKS